MLSLNVVVCPICLIQQAYAFSETSSEWRSPSGLSGNLSRYNLSPNSLLLLLQLAEIHPYKWNNYILHFQEPSLGWDSYVDSELWIFHICVVNHSDCFFLSMFCEKKKQPNTQQWIVLECIDSFFFEPTIIYYTNFLKSYYKWFVFVSPIHLCKGR